MVSKSRRVSSVIGKGHGQSPKMAKNIRTSEKRFFESQQSKARRKEKKAKPKIPLPQAVQSLIQKGLRLGTLMNIIKHSRSQGLPHNAQAFLKHLNFLEEQKLITPIEAEALKFSADTALRNAMQQPNSRIENALLIGRFQRPQTRAGLAKKFRIEESQLEEVNEFLSKAFQKSWVERKQIKF